MMIWIWLAVVAVSLIVEFISMELVSIWFALSGIIVMILSVFIPSWEVQLIVFIILSVLFIVFARKIAKKVLYSRVKDEKTNVESLIGSKHKLTESIYEDKPGALKVNGVTWSAITEDGDDVIPVDTYVIIQKVQGNKLIVKQEEEK